MEDDSALLHLLQMADSAFPIGAFAHSLGLEMLVQEEWLSGQAQGGSIEIQEALERLLGARLDLEMARTELPLLLAAHDAAAQHDEPALQDLNALAAATRPVREWRMASERMGRRLLVAVADFAPTPLLRALSATTSETGLQVPVAFGVTAQQLGCPVRPTALAFTASTLQSWLAAAVRLGLTGQRGVAQTFHRLKPDVEAAIDTAQTVPLECIGGSLPLLEIAGMRHEYAQQRLFIS